MSRFLLMLRGKPGWGVLFSLLVLLIVEFWLHTDHFLYNYRSVFAAGRAMDKVKFIESTPLYMLIVGNSRVDNGFNPQVIVDELSLDKLAFNLGVPGANARILYGLFTRFLEKNLLGKKGIKYVVLGLDESFFQADDSLGYSIFYADRAALFDNYELKDYFGSICRLWGYSSNLKQLREPAKIERFIQATVSSVEPWGGSAEEGLGFRAAKKGEFQNLAQVMRQEAGSKHPPDELTVNYFWQLIKLLQDANVKVAVVFPPLLNRNVLFLANEPSAKPYQRILNELHDHHVPILALRDGGVKKPEEFSNPGHLNESGAHRYSKLLAKELLNVWPEFDASYDL